MHKFIQGWLALFVTFVYIPAHAEVDVQASYYWDSRSYNTLNLQISENDLGKGFSFWGFTDFHGNQHDAKDRYEITRTFSEYRLSNDLIADWTGVKGLGLQLEYNDTTPGKRNNTLRFGATYKQGLGDLGWLQFRAFPVQSRNDGQLSLIYFFKLTERLNISGFADYNLNSGAKNQWVYEPQLNYRVTDHVWFLIEHRYNGFEASNPRLKGRGTAVGLRYNF